MEVKLVTRTLDVFELYARQTRPLSLTELARGLDVPMSSTLALVRTLVAKGFLYETRKRAGYYPTRRMRNLCQAIDAHDPLLDVLHPLMIALRNATGETVVLGKRQAHTVVYLDAVESTQAIRYTAAAGQSRPLHANSIGKALLAVMPIETLRPLLESLTLTPMRPRTLITPSALLADLEQTRARGWAENVGESFPDLAALAMPLFVNDEWYGVSIAGPLLRMQAAWDAHAQALKHCIDDMQAAGAAAEDETTHLLRNPHNARHLSQSITEANTGKVIKKTLAELDAMGK